MIGKKKVLPHEFLILGLTSVMTHVKNIIHTLILFSLRVFSKLSRVSSSLAKKFEPEDIQQTNVIRSTSYNMMAAPDESYYADQYWQLIAPFIKDVQKNALAMDLGCGQGRLTVLLSKKLDEVKFVACDLSESAIEMAKEYAKVNYLENIDFKVQGITDCIYSAEKNSVDVLILTEVTVFYPQWIKELTQMLDILKHGGLFIISLRSQYFNAMCLTRSRNWNNIDTVIKKREGELFDASTVLTWQTSEEIRKLLVEEHGLELLTICGLGACSGIPGDPHDQICRPSDLSATEKVELMKLEIELGKTVPDSGRYILAVVRKPE